MPSSSHSSTLPLSGAGAGANAGPTSSSSIDQGNTSSPPPGDGAAATSSSCPSIMTVSMSSSSPSLSSDAAVPCAGGVVLQDGASQPRCITASSPDPASTAGGVAAPGSPSLAATRTSSPRIRKSVTAACCSAMICPHSRMQVSIVTLRPPRGGWAQAARCWLNPKRMTVQNAATTGDTGRCTQARLAGIGYTWSGGGEPGR